MALSMPSCSWPPLLCPVGPCSVNETLPGLWEFPMWDVQNAEGVVLTNMDPQVGGNCSILFGPQYWEAFAASRDRGRGVFHPAMSLILLPAAL